MARYSVLSALTHAGRHYYRGSILTVPDADAPAVEKTHGKALRRRPAPAPAPFSAPVGVVPLVNLEPVPIGFAGFAEPAPAEVSETTETVVRRRGGR